MYFINLFLSLSFPSKSMRNPVDELFPMRSIHLMVKCGWCTSSPPGTEEDLWDRASS